MEGNDIFKDELARYIQEKGFIWGPEPELYGGSAGFYTYGPLGKLLKNRVEEKIREVFTRNDYWEIEAPTIMPAKVWEASGHLRGFTDPLIVCRKCKSVYRADHLVEELMPGKADTSKNVMQLIKQYELKCPKCGHDFEETVKDHTLMMKTTVGVDTEAYNRPETATTTYLPFIRYADFFRKKVPFGVFQIGKAYRNEISPRQHVLRMREFTQAEGQLFIVEKDDWEKFDAVESGKISLVPSSGKPLTSTFGEMLERKLVKSKAYAWSLWIACRLFASMGIPESRMRLREHGPEEKAFYAAEAWDLEVEFNSFGWVECCGIHDRTDYDLKQHAKFSGQTLAINTENGKQVPHILEIAFGVDRVVYGLLDIYYEKKEKGHGLTKLKIPEHIAPVQAAVLPLVKKPELTRIARAVQAGLKHIISVYDETGSIGKRYLRQDEIGTPFCITVDFDSIKDNSVTVRERDTAAQNRVKVDEVAGVLEARMKS